MQLKSIRDVKNLKGKRVLVRVDFNVPVKNGRVLEDYKIKKSLPTIEFLLRHGAKIALVSHLGRPKGVESALSLWPVKNHLEKLLRKKILFLKATISEKMLPRLAQGLAALPPGGLLLVENIRFFAAERAKDENFAKALAATADLFVSECFAVTHHPAPSISSPPKYLPSYAGLLLTEEIAGLSRVMEKPKRPFVVLLGGAKAETKIPVVKNLLPQADYILVSGGFFNTYLWAKGFKVGRSLVQPEFKAEILKYAKSKKLVVPVDVVAGGPAGQGARVLPLNPQFGIKNSTESIYDIGPASIQLFAEYIRQAATLVWNGPMGFFEQHPYEYGTFALAHLFAARSQGKAFGVVGGGETVQVFQKLGLADQIDLVSTGGGAMLEFLSGNKLPGIAALRAKR